MINVRGSLSCRLSSVFILKILCYYCIALEQRTGFNQHPRMKENLWGELGLRAVGWGDQTPFTSQTRASEPRLALTAPVVEHNVLQNQVQANWNEVVWVTGYLGKWWKGKGGKEFFPTRFPKSSHILDFHFYFTVWEKGGKKQYLPMQLTLPLPQRGMLLLPATRSKQIMLFFICGQQNQFCLQNS